MTDIVLVIPEREIRRGTTRARLDGFVLDPRVYQPGETPEGSVSPVRACVLRRERA